MSNNTLKLMKDVLVLAKYAADSGDNELATCLAVMVKACNDRKLMNFIYNIIAITTREDFEKILKDHPVADKGDAVITYQNILMLLTNFVKSIN